MKRFRSEQNSCSAWTARTFSVVLFLCYSFLLPPYAGTGACAAEQPAFDFDIRTPEAAGLIYFIQSLAGEAHHNEMSANFFHHERQETESDKTALEDYRRAMEGEAPIAEKRNFETSIEMLAAMSTSLGNFLESTSAFLSVQNYAKFQAAVGHFTPFYESNILSVYENNLRLQKNAIMSEAKRIDFVRKMRSVATMYQSEWPANCKFTAVLVPIPLMSAHNYSSYGHSDGPVVFIESIGGEPVAGRLGVMFHEICHALWQERSASTKKKLFEQFNNVNGLNAYNVLDESLATALGNAYIVEVATGKLKNGGWYNDHYVDKFAQLIYPLTIQYLNAGKPLDQTYAEQVSKMFNSAFPEANLDPQLALWNVVGITGDTDSARATPKLLPSTTHSSSIYPITELPAFLRSIETQPTASTLVLCREDQLKDLQALPLSSEDATSIAELWKNDPSRAWGKLKGQRWLIVCLGATAKEQEAKLTSLVRAKVLPVADDQVQDTQSK